MAVFLRGRAKHAGFGRVKSSRWETVILILKALRVSGLVKLAPIDDMCSLGAMQQSRGTEVET
ncbi:hypothetical protein NQZ68_007694 [Dissostichus eleginoides]|nr:hypothetical protein NQZ68_007694 [Dissostichus eleginoides]